MNLTEHFTLEELTVTQHRGFDNSPSDKIILHLTDTALGLEKVRTLLGAPIHINSGYRCPELNAAIGGAAHSAHMDGYAADFICPAFGSPLMIVKAIAASGIAFDKCIEEGTWVHISFDPQMRHQLMTAHFGPNGTTYTNGVT